MGTTTNITTTTTTIDEELGKTPHRGVAKAPRCDSKCPFYVDLLLQCV
jgi:hypothetical protein